MPKGRLPKNARNYAKWKAEQERGPVRTFFHITENTNLPAIKRVNEGIADGRLSVELLPESASAQDILKTIMKAQLDKEL